MRIIAASLLAGLAMFVSGAFVSPGIAFVTDLKGEAATDGPPLTLMTEVADGQNSYAIAVSQRDKRIHAEKANGESLLGSMQDAKAVLAGTRSTTSPGA